MLQVDHTELTVIGHVCTEGELVYLLRQQQPDIVVVDNSLRSDAPHAWFEYLQRLSKRSRLVWVEQEKVVLLPALVLTVVGIHLLFVRKHGITPPYDAREEHLAPLEVTK